MNKKDVFFEQPIYVTRPLLPQIEEVYTKLQEIWDTKWLTNNGLQHKNLEEKIKEILNIPYISLFNNGTIALLTACKALELSGEVITSPFSFPATTTVLTWNKLEPVFSDIDPVTMNIDANKIESLITDKTTAIMPVHVFGVPCDVEKIDEIACKYNLKVIYDAAHCFGVEVNGKSIGYYGDISMLSFHATKLFHTIEGGALLTKNEEFKKKCDLLKNFGIKNEEEVVLPGINGKMNEVQAAMGLVVLNYVEEEKKKRKLLIDVYKKNLKDFKGISYTDDLHNVKSNYQYFVIRINESIFGKSRDFVYEELKKYNVFARKYFYPLISNYDFYKDMPSADKESLPVANQVVKEVLCMPLYGELTAEDIEKICNILRIIKEQ